MCFCAYEYRYSVRPEEKVGFLGVGVAGSCEQKWVPEIKFKFSSGAGQAHTFAISPALACGCFIYIDAASLVGKDLTGFSTKPSTEKVTFTFPED